MLRGYRLLIASACGVAIFASLGAGAYFGSLYGPEQKQYQSITANGARQDGYQGPTKSLPDIAGVPNPVERLIANPPPDTGLDHEKRDLAAQEASALWAFWAVMISFFAAGITAVGTFLIYEQIVLTRKAVEDTGKATEAMREQTKIALLAVEEARQANKIARQSAIDSSRPWICLDMPMWQFKGNTTIDGVFYKRGTYFWVTFKNSGGSAAIVKSAVFDYKLVSIRDPLPIFTDRVIDQVQGVAPGGAFAFRDCAIGGEIDGKFLNGELALFYFVSLNYTHASAPDQSYNTTICIRYNVNGDMTSPDGRTLPFVETWPWPGVNTMT